MASCFEQICGALTGGGSQDGNTGTGGTQLPYLNESQSAQVMSALSAAFGKVANTKVQDTNEASGSAPINSGAQTHMIVVSLDYPGTGNELTCTKDGDNIQELARQSGVSDMTVLYNNEGNYAQVEAAIQEVGGRCQPGDFFIFYYSGHGASVPDENGDEKDGMDEAFCLVTPEGQLDWDKFMTDDQFAALVTTNVQCGVYCIILSDCCHSGTISDFKDPAWEGHAGISISGCQDAQTSGDTGNGGIFTHSMLMAIAELKEQGDDDYSIGKMYNKTLDKDDAVFDSKQVITIAHSPSSRPESMAWPLIPSGSYTAPWGN